MGSSSRSENEPRSSLPKNAHNSKPRRSRSGEPTRSVNRKVMVSATEASAIDAVRGTLKRGAWVRRACVMVARNDLFGELPRLKGDLASSQSTRNVEIGFRLHPHEYDAIETASSKLGLAVATWMREAAVRVANTLRAGDSLKLDPVNGPLADVNAA